MSAMLPLRGQIDLAPSRPKGTRQRVAVACVPCRVKRMRCDGVEPCCGPCNSRDISCEYQHTENKRKPPSKKLVRSLQARIEVLEQQISALGSPVPPEPNDVTEDSDSETEYTTRLSTARTQQINPLAEISDITAELSLASDGQLRYFGSLSNYNLLQGRLHEFTAEPPSIPISYNFTTLAEFNNGQGIAQELQDHLLNLYWKWQNPWNCVVHQDAFMQDYKHDYTGRYCTPLLLLAIFALAARYSDRVEVRSIPDNPKTAGEPFGHQAKTLLQHAVESPTVPTVQAVVLLGLNAMAEDRESLGWLYVGMAMRMAFNLGLNLDCSHWVSTGHLSELEGEVRKVAWWGCYTLDKLFSLGHGRPGMTRKHDISCPMPSQTGSAEFSPWTPWSYKDESLRGAHVRISSTSYYTSALLAIATETLDILYAPSNELKQHDLAGLITHTDIALNVFYQDLPSYLRLPASMRTACLPHIYQLHIEYHVIQILLHRPFIVKRRVARRVLSSSSEESDSHLQACRRSALEVTKILRAYQEHYTLRLVPIVTVHNTFTAAIIHLMDATSTASIIYRRGIHNLRICVEALESMSTAWCWSCRAIRALRLLAQDWLSPEAVKNGGLSKPQPSVIECSSAVSRYSIEDTTSSTYDTLPGDLISGADTETIFQHALDDSGETGVPPIGDLSWLLLHPPEISNQHFGQEVEMARLDPWVTGVAQSTFAVPSWDEDM